MTITAKSVDLKMMEKAEQAKEKLESLKRELNDSMAETERATRNSFDVSELGKAFSVAQKAAQDVNRIIKEREVIVHTMDIACRALLPEKPSVETVEAVYEAVKTLNAFEINFSVSASLDRSEVTSAGRELDASLTAKMIEAFWESTYTNHPDYDAYQAKKRQALIEQRNRRFEEYKKWQTEKEEQERKRLEEEKRAEEAYEEKAKAIRDLRERELREKVDEWRKTYLKTMEEEHTNSLRRAEEMTSESKKKKEAAEKELAGLGFMAFGRKKASRQTIRDMEAAIGQAGRDRLLAEEKYAKAKETFDTEMRKFEETARKEIEAAHPIPQDPREAKRIQAERQKEMEDAILDCLREGGSYTISQLMAKSNVLGKKANQQVSVAVGQMVRKGILVREEHARKAYFRKA